MRPDIRWLAGHFEGEGTITIVRSRAKRYVYTRAVVCLTSTDAQVPPFFHERWGGSLSWKQPKGNARPALLWRIDTIPLVEGFLTEITPHLQTERVRQKAALVLLDVRERVQGKRGNELAAYRTQREERLRDVQALNQRGSLRLALPAGG